MSILTYKGVVYTFGTYDTGCSACDLKKYCALTSRGILDPSKKYVASLCREHIREFRKSTEKYVPFHFEIHPLYTLLEELKSENM